MFYTNPYNRIRDYKNWMRWNVGEEDGSRGMLPRGESIAYKDGYNAGHYHRLLQLNAASFAQTPGSGKGHSR